MSPNDILLSKGISWVNPRPCNGEKWRLVLAPSLKNEYIDCLSTFTGWRGVPKKFRYVETNHVSVSGVFSVSPCWDQASLPLWWPQSKWGNTLNTIIGSHPWAKKKTWPHLIKACLRDSHICPSPESPRNTKFIFTVSLCSNTKNMFLSFGEFAKSKWGDRANKSYFHEGNVVL